MTLNNATFTLTADCMLRVGCHSKEPNLSVLRLDYRDRQVVIPTKFAQCHKARPVVSGTYLLAYSLVRNNQNYVLGYYCAERKIWWRQTSHGYTTHLKLSTLELICNTYVWCGIPADISEEARAELSELLAEVQA